MIYAVWNGTAEKPRTELCCVTQDKNLVKLYLREKPECIWLEVWEDGAIVDSCCGKDSSWLPTL